MGIEKVLGDIKAERVKQDEQWGGPNHDDDHAECDWRDYIEKQLEGARFAGTRKERRKRYVKIAALAVAAIESMDRG